MGAEISERKKKILQIVVDEYIETATPVSSKAITQKHLTEVSSATVRSELAALEDQGYLIQFHTSGGRIPSPKAYRLYIDELMERSELSSAEAEFIRSSFERRAASAESIVRSVADVISELTDYTSIAVAAHDGSLRPLRRPVVYHAYMILAFLSVVMTYWGVNYFLGGLHSYA